MIEDRVRRIVGEHGKLAIDVSAVAGSADLYEAGLTSFATVQLMLALEDEFNIEIPDRLLNRKTFQTIDEMSDAVRSLLPAESVA